ncbi:MAG: hypothetical protein H8E73_04270 [Planctomycetes bacterium]|nr:hypothetical protein [Planctomycetota bacterium]MBL7188984.1 hypothetical protein [Phycisphaerae bacterium]
MNQTHPIIYTVRQIQKETHNVTSVILSGNPDEALKIRRAGQFVTLQLPANDGWSEPHPYTLSGAPSDPFLQITAKALGPFSLRLQSVASGTQVAVSGPHGSFCRDIESHRSIVMIAGGIGITPFLSVLRHLHHIKFDADIVLFWANNDWADYFALDEIQALADPLSLWTVLVCLQPASQWPSPIKDETMFLTQGYLTENVLRQHSDPNSSKVYVCGSPNMQAYVSQQLKACGVELSSVETEQFGVFHFGLTK